MVMEIKLKLVLGKEFQKSQSERGAIEAAIWNTKRRLKYLKGSINDGIYTHENAVSQMIPLYNELLSVEWLVKIYHELWQEKFSKIKTQTEKFINS